MIEVTTTVLWMVMAASDLRCRRCEDIDVEFYSAPSESLSRQEYAVGSDISWGYSDAIEEMLAKDFGAVADVKSVLAEDVSDTLLVWIIVDDPSQSVRHRIYEKEMSLMSEFPDIPFDFNLIPSMGRSANDVVTGAKIVYSRDG